MTAVLLATLIGAATVGALAGDIARAAGDDIVAQSNPAGAPLQVAPGEESPFAQSAVDADVVVMDVALGPDGTARWEVSFRTRLEDDNATAAFESVRADIEANSSAYTAQFGDRMRRTAATAANATGREMAVENVTVEAAESDPLGEYGVVTYRFRWANFAVSEGGRIEAGDALSGLFLDSDTRLVVRWPEGYEARSVTPEPSDEYDDRVVWEGPIDFTSEEPRVVAGQPGPLSGLGLPLLAGGLLLVATVAGAVVLARRGGLAEADTSGEGPAGGASGGEAGGAAAASAGGDAGDVTDDDGEEGGGSDDGPPEELLSNEERVLHLLDERGGRIKQQEIAGELDWTDAKTSQVIGKLRDQDEVETFRIGRENVVALPEESDL